MTISQAFALATQHQQTGRLAEAEAFYRGIVEAQPGHAEAWHRLGIIACQTGRRDLGAEWMRQSIAHNPDNPAAHANLGEAYRTAGHMEEAIACYHRALALKPHYPQVYQNLGMILARRGELDQAIGAFRRALEDRPDFAEAHYHLGNALRDQLRFDEAAACYQRATDANPRLAGGHLNLGMTSMLQRRFPEAEACFRRAMASQPDSAKAHLNLALVLLLLGRYEEGWREYEWRWHLPGNADRLRQITRPWWNGTPINGRTLLLHAEQGYGDTLQFIRYLPLVRARARAGRLIFKCPPPLVPLLEQVADDDVQIVPSGYADEELLQTDLQIPLASLPLALGCLEPMVANAPYLEAEATLRAQWRERLGAGQGLKIGLAWAGNPAHANDRLRSISPEKLSPILGGPGIRWVSLQVDPEAPLPPALAAAGVLDFRAALTNFAESAALLAELDLIITVDTAAAHLAGALGRPAWVLLPLVPDWRWGLDREDSPWYPTMRLFRQDTTGDWQAVLERVAIALGHWRGHPSIS